MTLTRHLGLALVLLAALAGTHCARNTPPNLSPEASLAFDSGRIVNALDDVRDIAIVANAFTPQPFTTPITGRVVLAHASLLEVVEKRADRWEVQVQNGLSELVKNLQGDVGQRLTPYIELVRALLARLSRDIDAPTSAAVLAAYQELLRASKAIDAAWLAQHP